MTYRVLLIEMDPQGNNGEDLGFIGTDLYDGGAGQATGILTGAGLKPTGEARPGLWVVPGGEALEDVVEGSTASGARRAILATRAGCTCTPRPSRRSPTTMT